MWNWLCEVTEMKPFVPAAWRVTHGRLFCDVLTACMTLCTDLSWSHPHCGMWKGRWHLLLSTRLSCWLKEETGICSACSGPRLSGAYCLVGSTWHCVKHPAWSGKGTENIADPFEIRRAAAPGSYCPLTNLAVAWLSCFVDSFSHQIWLYLTSGCQWWLVWWTRVAPYYIYPWPYWSFHLSTFFFFSS